MVYLPAAVTHPSTNPARRRVTSLIGWNALRLRHATNLVTLKVSSGSSRFWQPQPRRLLFIASATRDVTRKNECEPKLAHRIARCVLYDSRTGSLTHCTRTASTHLEGRRRQRRRRRWRPRRSWRGLSQWRPISYDHQVTFSAEHRCVCELETSAHRYALRLPTTCIWSAQRLIGRPMVLIGEDQAEHYRMRLPEIDRRLTALRWAFNRRCHIRHFARANGTSPGSAARRRF